MTRWATEKRKEKQTKQHEIKSLLILRHRSDYYYSIVKIPRRVLDGRCETWSVYISGHTTGPVPIDRWTFDTHRASFHKDTWHHLDERRISRSHWDRQRDDYPSLDSLGSSCICREFPAHCHRRRWDYWWNTWCCVSSAILIHRVLDYICDNRSILVSFRCVAELLAPEGRVSNSAPTHERATTSRERERSELDEDTLDRRVHWPFYCPRPVERSLCPCSAICRWPLPFLVREACCSFRVHGWWTAARWSDSRSCSRLELVREIESFQFHPRRIRIEWRRSTSECLILPEQCLEARRRLPIVLSETDGRDERKKRMICVHTSCDKDVAFIWKYQVHSITRPKEHNERTFAKLLQTGFLLVNRLRKISTTLTDQPDRFHRRLDSNLIVIQTTSSEPLTASSGCWPKYSKSVLV